MNLRICHEHTMEIYRISVVLLLLPRHSSALTLTGPPYAVLDQTYQFTCNVTGSTTEQTLSFRRDRGATCTIAFPSDPTNCQQFQHSPGYSCSCGQNGVYYMNISSVNLTDETIWNCQLPTQSSNNISLAVYYGPDTNQVRVTKTPDVVAIENRDITLTCETLTSVSPRVTFTWEYSDGSAISGGSTGTVTGSLGSMWLQTRTFQPIRSKTNVRCTVGNTRTGVTASGELSLDVKWYPAKPSNNCPSYIVEGQTGSCICQTSDSGNPAGTVQWINPLGQTVSSSSVLNLASIPRPDNGKNYICRAGNSLVNSNMDTVYRVDMTYGPDTNQVRITKTPDVVAIENRNITLTCETLTSVSPGVTFTWEYSDGSALSYGSTGTVTGSLGSTWLQTRTFQPIRSKTNVRCTVGNTRTGVTASGELSLDVKWPPPGNPSITSFPSVMYSGEQRTIQCTVTGGNPLADITWSCYNTSNTGTESGSKTSSLTFLVTKQQNGQQCQCRATWIHGGYDKTDAETFNVYYSPETPTVTGPVNLCEGTSTSMTCSSSPDSGNPPATYYWSKNNVQTHTGSVYTFTPGKDDHRAQIRCAAGNAFTDRSGQSRPQSGTRQINVYYIRMSTTENQTKKEGQNLSLNCSATSNPDSAVVSWTFEGSPLTGVSVVKSNLSRSDHGVYTCSGRVNTGSVCPGGSLQRDGIVNVTVNYAPSITFSPAVISEGNTLTLTCKAHGRPQSYTFGHFTQYWGTETVDTQIGEKTTEEYTWSKQKASYLDTGVYECSVDNGISDRHGVSIQRKRVSVHVRVSPKFTPDTSQMIGAEVGSAVRLSQMFYNSNLNYTSVNWTFVNLNSVINESANVRRSNVTLKKNGKSFKFEGFVASVIITNFREQDIGVYTVTVCNSIGCNSSNVNLTAAGPPLVPLDFTATNTTQTSISLRWKPNFPGGDFTQVFILHYRLQGSGDWQTQEYEDNPGGYVYADITDLQPGSVYEFRVKARNNRRENNEGNFTKIIQKTTETLPTSEEPNSSIGVGLGIGLGICLLIIIGLVITLIYFYRRIKLSSQSTGKDHQPDNQGTGGPLGNGGFISGQSHSQDQPDYAHLEQRSPEQYEQIRLYENTKGKSKYSNENLQESSPATTYEKVDPHIYVNRENDPRDPTYINRPKV